MFFIAANCLTHDSGAIPNLKIFFFNLGILELKYTLSVKKNVFKCITPILLKIILKFYQRGHFKIKNKLKGQFTFN